MHPNSRAGNSRAYRGVKRKRKLVNGVWYDSTLEATMAEILHRHGVKFKPHHLVIWTDRRTKANQKWRVDFAFPRPIRMRGVNNFFDIIEVGVITDEKVQRIASLEDAKPVNVFLAVDDWVRFWYREGLL